jgi:hypothetical protein
MLGVEQLIECPELTRAPAVVAILLPMLLVITTGGAVEAQDEPSTIGPFVVDVRGSFPSFPEDPLLASSRGLDVRELPGRGYGLDAGAHVYLLKWKAVTIGLGGQYTIARSRSSPETGLELRSVTERFTSITPQLSLNFGSGDGWSYLSAGRGTSTWSIVPDDQQPGSGDRERLTTFNYGGGARWFARPHLAFTFDVRVHEVAPGSPESGRPGSPRTFLLVLSAGVSVK